MLQRIGGDERENKTRIRERSRYNRKGMEKQRRVVTEKANRKERRKGGVMWVDERKVMLREKVKRGRTDKQKKMARKQRKSR